MVSMKHVNTNHFYRRCFLEEPHLFEKGNQIVCRILHSRCLWEPFTHWGSEESLSRQSLCPSTVRGFQFAKLIQSISNSGSTRMLGLNVYVGAYVSMLIF